MTGLLLILLALITIFIAFLIFQSLGGKFIGAKIEEIGMFNGPTLSSFNIGGLKFSLNFLPLGSYVKFTEGFQGLATFKKIFVVLAGLASYLFIALTGLGFEETMKHFLSGFGQIFRGVFSPVAVGSGLIGSLADVLKERSFIAGTGILAAKSLALNLLPIGTLGGGMLVLYLLELIGFKSEKIRERFQLIGLLVLLIILAAWTIALAAFVWRVFVK